MSLSLTTTLFLCATSGAADVAAVRATPVIDGVITDSEWNGAAVITLDHQIRPGDNVPPSVRTEARFAFDARNLYLAITAHDDEAHAVRGPVSRRDAILDDDFVTVDFDTYDDRRRAYVFSLTRAVCNRTASTPRALRSVATSTATSIGAGMACSRRSVESARPAMSSRPPFHSRRCDLPPPPKHDGACTSNDGSLARASESRGAPSRATCHRC